MLSCEMTPLTRTYGTYFEYCEAVHHYIFVPSVGEKEETVSPGSRLLSKVIQQLLCRNKKKKKEVGMNFDGAARNLASRQTESNM